MHDSKQIIIQLSFNKYINDIYVLGTPWFIIVPPPTVTRLPVFGLIIVH